MSYLIKSHGFTLIEVLIALVILSVALLGLAGLMVQTTRNTSFGGLMTEAATFAQDKLEELRATSWNNLGSFSGGPELLQGSNKIYNRTWAVQPNPPSPGDTVRTISVTVTWDDRTRRTVTLRSVLSH